MRDARPERVRQPAVAGAFYPDGMDALQSIVDGFLSRAPARSGERLQALISPHAGYRYSGIVAAQGFKSLVGRHFDQVVVMGPSHHVAFRGVALPEVDAWQTPLGRIEMASRARELAGESPFVLASAPHEREHSVEVELPFLQRTLHGFELWPLVFGAVDEAAVAQRLSKLVGPGTLFVASSDLSHYLPYDTAVTTDRATIDAVLRLDTRSVAYAEACGRSPILTLVHLARQHGWQPELLDYRNSGDTAGDHSRVVGYASIAFFQDDR